MNNAIRGPSSDNHEPDCKMTVEEAADYGRDNASVTIQPSVVCHFFSDLPAYEGRAPNTSVPKLKISTIDYTCTPFLSLTMENRQHSSDGLG